VLFWCAVFDAKRLIGRHFSDPLVQEDMKHWPFTVKSAPGDKPMIEVQFKGETKEFSPEEISSMVLVKMRDTASAFVGKVGPSGAARQQYPPEAVERLLMPPCSCVVRPAGSAVMYMAAHWDFMLGQNLW